MGVYNDNDTPANQVAKIPQTKKKKWQSTQCLIIDEISMISGDLFDSFDQIGQLVWYLSVYIPSTFLNTLSAPSQSPVVTFSHSGFKIIFDHLIYT